MAKLAEILNRFLPSHKRKYALSAQQSKVFGSVMACRTARLGASIQTTCQCGKEIIAYNSCRDRHCTQCQGRASRRWVAAQSEKLLPARYHHCVFTLPDVLCTLVRYNERLLYGLLFTLSAACLKTFFANDTRFGGQAGFLGILHTWGQRLQLHPHVHYIVACGSLQSDGSWHGGDGYLFDVRNLSKVFRGSFLAALEKLQASGKLKLPPGWDEASFRRNLHAATKKDWIVYTKETFCSPEKVIEYIGRYAHKVAISEGRILEIDEKSVTIEYKDYRADGVKKTTTIRGDAFVRLFAQHILPFRFTRIRYYGFWNTVGLQKARAAIKESGKQVCVFVEALLAIAGEITARHEEYGIRCPACGVLAYEADVPNFTSLKDFLDTS